MFRLFRKHLRFRSVLFLRRVLRGYWLDVISHIVNECLELLGVKPSSEMNLVTEPLWVCVGKSFRFACEYVFQVFRGNAVEAVTTHAKLSVKQLAVDC